MALAAEYGLVVGTVDPVVLDVVEDIAEASGDAAGARALQHAARELLAERFAELAGDGPPLRVTIEAGPPLTSRSANLHGGRADSARHARPGDRLKPLDASPR